MIARYPLRVPTAWESATDPETGAAILIAVAFDPRCHVNIAVDDLTAEIALYRVHPEAPRLAMAGDSGPDWPLTAFLRFADEAEMTAILGAQP